VKISRATWPREPVAIVARPMSSLNATTFGRSLARCGTTHSRTMHSIFVRNAA
jgi:hypothetical protein